MALIVNRKEYSILENNKPDLAGSDLWNGRCMTETNRDVSIVADRPIFCNRSSQMSKGFKVIPHSILESSAWQGATFKYRAFLIEILLRCVWKKTTFVSNGHVIDWIFIDLGLLSALEKMYEQYFLYVVPMLSS